MSKSNMREKIGQLVEQKGRHYVMARLIEQRVSSSTAEKLVRKTYPKEPYGTLMTVIEQILSREAHRSTEDEIYGATSQLATQGSDL